MAGNPNPVIPVHTQFKPGNPGGPGRPAKRPLSEAYDDWLREPVSTDQIIKLREQGIRVPKDATNATMVALAQGRKAIAGDTTAAKELGDRTEGKPAQRIEIMNPTDKRFEVAVTYAQPIKTIEARRELVEQVEDKILQDAIETAVVEAVNQDENE